MICFFQQRVVAFIGIRSSYPVFAEVVEKKDMGEAVKKGMCPQHLKDDAIYPIWPNSCPVDHPGGFIRQGKASGFADHDGRQGGDALIVESDRSMWTGVFGYQKNDRRCCVFGIAV